MALTPDAEVDKLQKSVAAYAARSKGKYLKDILQVTEPLMIWLGYLRTSVTAKVADILLDAAHGSIIEVGGWLSLGLARPAIFSIRAQLEAVLAWTYFNDHPIEWRYFEKTRKDYPARAELVGYMKNNSVRFQNRFKILVNRRKRGSEDPYNLLSVHVHAIPPFAGPQIGPLSALVQSESTCEECVNLESEVVEYLTDTLAS